MDDVEISYFRGKSYRGGWVGPVAEFGIFYF